MKDCGIFSDGFISFLVDWRLLHGAIWSVNIGMLIAATYAVPLHYVVAQVEVEQLQDQELENVDLSRVEIRIRRGEASVLDYREDRAALIVAKSKSVFAWGDPVFIKVTADGYTHPDTTHYPWDGFAPFKLFLFRYIPGSHFINVRFCLC